MARNDARAASFCDCFSFCYHDGESAVDNPYARTGRQTDSKQAADTISRTGAFEPHYRGGPFVYAAEFLDAATQFKTSRDYPPACCKNFGSEPPADADGLIMVESGEDVAPDEAWESLWAPE